MHPAALKLFLEVADLGSFSKAAVARRTVQSHISRQISELERECGARLFRRTGRGVVLTDLGERIAPRVRTWLAEMCESDREKETVQRQGLPRTLTSNREEPEGENATAIVNCPGPHAFPGRIINRQKGRMSIV